MGAGTALLILVLVPFGAALLGSNAGEAAGALGGVIGGIAGGVLAALSAYIAVRETLRGEAAHDEARRDEELASIRLALVTEVGMIAFQCLMEYRSWKEARDKGGGKDARTAFLPPLRIYNAMVGQLGRLTRDEIVSLIGFSGTLADIERVASRIPKDPGPTGTDKAILAQLFSNGCGHAASFMEQMKILPDAEKDKAFIAELRKAWNEGQAERDKAARAFNIPNPKPQT